MVGMVDMDWIWFASGRFISDFSGGDREVFGGVLVITNFLIISDFLFSISSSLFEGVYCNFFCGV